jgi:hypothetical protein
VDRQRYHQFSEISESEDQNLCGVKLLLESKEPLTFIGNVL